MSISSLSDSQIKALYGLGGGGGSAQTLSQSGNNILLSGGGGSVDVSTTTSVQSSAQKTTAQTYSEGLLATTFDGDLFTKRTQVGSALEPTTLSVFQNVEQYGDSAIHQFFDDASVPQGSIGLVGGVNLNITTAGGLTMGKSNTGSGNGSIDIIDGEVRMVATDFVGVLDGTDLRLSGGVIDNSLSSGTAGQFLGCGAGGEVLWATPGGGGGGIVAVNAGTNISIPDPGIPVVSLAISSAIEMNSYNITSTGALAVQSDVSVSLDAPFVYLPQLATASTSKMLYYDDTTKAVSYSDAPAVDGVQSVVAGSNLAVDNTDPANPIVAVVITSDLDMASHNLTNGLNVGCETATVGEALNYVDSGSVICADTKAGFYQGLLCQNKSSSDHASANVVCVNDSAGSDYSAIGINSSVFGNLYNTVFEIPNATYASGTADTVIGSQSDHVVSGNHSLYLAYNSGSGAFCINTQGALSMNASNPGGVLNKGDFGTAGQLLTSAGSGAPPTWEDPPALLTILGATVGDAPLNTVVPATWLSVTVIGGSYRIPLYQ